VLWKRVSSACPASINSLARPAWHHTFSDVVLCRACTNTCKRVAKACRIVVIFRCLPSSAHPELYTMFGATVVLALATLGAVNPAAATGQQNQLETARMPQPVQRLEFGVEGDNSAFKFRFADPVPLSFFVSSSCLIRTKVHKFVPCIVLDQRHLCAPFESLDCHPLVPLYT
jgi:hypothetical protein